MQAAHSSRPVPSAAGSCRCPASYWVLHHPRRSHIAASKARTGSPTKQAQGALLLDAKTQAFVQWCLKDLGVANDKLQPAVFTGVRGMAASKAIAQEDLLISIPRASAIVLAPKQPCPCPDYVSKDYWSSQQWFVKIAIMLLNEKRLGTKSRLARYIEQLPTQFEAPALWTPAQLQQLQYPFLIDKVTAQRKEWQALHQKFCAALQPGQQTVSIQQFMWALCAVRSRTFSGPYIGSSLKDRIRLAGVVAALAGANIALGLANVERTLTAVIGVFVFNVLYEVILSRSLKQYAMAPLLDFINHASDTKSEVSLDYFTDRYSATAGRSFAQGEQVFISYGEQTNDSLMQYYGFVEADNPADTYIMTRMLQWLPRHVTSITPGMLQQLQDAGLKKALDQVVIARTGFPAQTLQALRFLIAASANSADVAIGPASFSSAGDDASEQRLATVLVAVLNDELTALGTTLTADQETLSGSANSKPKQLSMEESLAVHFRIEKKQILHAALSSLGAQPAAAAQ